MSNPQPPTTNARAELREKLAAIEHERWADWQKWVHQQMTLQKPTPFGAQFTIPAETVYRWDRQIITPYDRLSDQEKASDMEQVDRYWPLIEQYLAAFAEAAIKALPEEIEEGDGWDTYFSNGKEKGKVRPCCPGDDIAYAHNTAIDQSRAAITTELNRFIGGKDDA